MKASMIVGLTFLLSGCVIAEPHHHKHYYDCTQVQEANGECENRVIPEPVPEEAPRHKHHQEQAQRYKSADGVTMITRNNVTLPACGETGGSQADNGSTCWF